LALLRQSKPNLKFRKGVWGRTLFKGFSPEKVFNVAKRKPIMLTLKNSFYVSRNIESVWNFLNRVEELAFCMPTCKKLDVVDEKTVDTVLRVTLGRLPIESEARFTITEALPPNKLTARGQVFMGRSMGGVWRMVDRKAEAEVLIELELEEASPDKTAIHYLIEIRAEGRLKRIYDSVVKSKGEEIERTFVDNINSRIP
jgi:carbon monoxide dehydrogenase subunit G